MLTISKPLSASQAQTYHEKEFTSPDQSYWNQGQTVQGEWHGKLAEKFGLAGAVGADEFARLSEGQHPATAEQLVQHRQSHTYQNAEGKTVTSVEHRAGWDATFSAPKSVSLTALVGNDSRVREAHREAVNAALNELERYTQARIGGNHPAEKTGQFVAAKFEHDTARPVDGYAAPQLHTHTVIFNMTEREDGSFRALQPQGLFDSQQFATAVYQSELMYRLRSLGYEIEPGRSGAPEIKGYSQEYLDASSPRSQQIREYLEKTDARAQLNTGQRAAIEQVLTSRDTIQGLQGSAGVGKTSALTAIREGAEQQGYVVEGFAPTSRAAQQLRDAGIAADTLQAFLARPAQEASAGGTGSHHLYIVDESSLASTKQMRDFLEKIGFEDRVLLIGDTRQHQAVDAGKPFEQLQQAGMHTAQLDQIVRQKDPELLRAVEHLAKGEVAPAIAALEQQGRITEIVDPQQRIAAIAKNYVAHPENTLIVSPDNASRREINQAVRLELRALGVVDKTDHAMRVLTPRNDMTGAERAWAAHYQAGDVLHYIRGSKELGIERGSYVQVVSANSKENLVTVQKQDGEEVTYDPSRLRGISAYREIEREFAVGDRIQFTAPNRTLHVANRDLGTIEHIGQDGPLSVRMDNGKAVMFDANEMRHFDHGYAVTSHSSQGLTAERVLINIDTDVHPDLIDSRFAYVSVSRASHEAHIYTDNATSLGEKLSRDVSKTAAVDLTNTHSHAAEQSMGQQRTPGNVGMELSL